MLKIFMIKPQIISPGGSYTKALVAAKNWADAVYMWLPFASLRMWNNDVRRYDILAETMAAVRWQGSNVYLTMNILPRNIDIKILESVAEKVADLKPDAIIFTDLWTYRIIKKYLPNTKLHLSTQASTLNYEAIQFWADLWVQRVVLARELNLKEVEQIKHAVPNMELEIFVHWAMCMTYSWRCLLWEYFEGREWNKWNCWHICRHWYKVYLEEERRPWTLFQIVEDDFWSYLMSSKDMCVIERVKEIMDANVVDAFKIEWRSKSELYAAATTKAYRHVVDSIYNWTPVDENIKNLVYQIPHRFYWEGFLFNDLRFAPDWENKWWDYQLEKLNIEKVNNIDEFFEQKKENGDFDKQLVEENLTWAQENTFDAWVSNEIWATLASVTKTTSGPVMNKFYMWVISDQYIEKNWKTFYEVIVKDKFFVWEEFDVVSPKWIEKIKITGLLDKNQNEVERITCNDRNTYITWENISPWQVIYK